MTEHDTTWLTRQDAANLAQVSMRTIDRWRATGTLPTHYIQHRYVRIAETDLRRITDPRPSL